jgi:hypothetical protein
LRCCGRGDKECGVSAAQACPSTPWSRRARNVQSVSVLVPRKGPSRPFFLPPDVVVRGTWFLLFFLALVVERKAKMPCSIAVEPFSPALRITTRKILDSKIFFFFSASDRPRSWSACLNFLEAQTYGLELEISLMMIVPSLRPLNLVHIRAGDLGC